jgi:hypothetical protein
MKNLNSSNYSAAKQALGIENFRIRVFDTNSSSYAFEFGDEVPRRGDVVAFQRYFLFQNSTGEIREARLTALTW